MGWRYFIIIIMHFTVVILLIKSHPNRVLMIVYVENVVSYRKVTPDLIRLIYRGDDGYSKVRIVYSKIEILTNDPSLHGKLLIFIIFSSNMFKFFFHL